MTADGRIQAKPVRHLNMDTGKWIDMRSTLEGRWAVFFDYLNIKWVYEPDRHPVDGTVRTSYLPDFWLPEHNVWVEVKGKATLGDIQLLAAAANPVTGLPFFDDGPRIIMLGNIPKVEHGWTVSQCVLSWEFDPRDQEYGTITQYFEFTPGQLFGGAMCEVWSDPPMGIWHNERTLRVDATSIWHFDSRPHDISDMPAHWGMALQPVVVEAYKAARSAKFESASQSGGSGR